MKVERHVDQEMSRSILPQPGRRRFLAAACALAPALAGANNLPQLEGNGDEHASVGFTTEARVDAALRQFGMGFHCSQSVLETYAADFGIDPMVARRMAAALAGGSTVGGECGAVASGYLILGLRHAGTSPAYGDVDKEVELFGRIARFVAEFRKLHGAITCRELLGVDVFTKEGRDEALRKNLFANRCQNYIRDAITILDSLG